MPCSKKITNRKQIQKQTKTKKRKAKTKKAKNFVKEKIARAPFVVSAATVVSVASVVSAVCDQVSQVVPVQQVDDIDEVHQLDPAHQVDHKDEPSSDIGATVERPWSDLSDCCRGGGRDKRRQNSAKSRLLRRFWSLLGRYRSPGRLAIFGLGWSQVSRDPDGAR